MMKSPLVTTTINKLRIMDKMKELQATLRKLRASLQSIKTSKDTNPNPGPQ